MNLLETIVVAWLSSGVALTAAGTIALNLSQRRLEERLASERREELDIGEAITAASNVIRFPAA